MGFFFFFLNLAFSSGCYFVGISPSLLLKSPLWSFSFCQRWEYVSSPLWTFHFGATGQLPDTKTMVDSNKVNLLKWGARWLSWQSRRPTHRGFVLPCFLSTLQLSVLYLSICFFGYLLLSLHYILKTNILLLTPLHFKEGCEVLVSFRSAVCFVCLFVCFLKCSWPHTVFFTEGNQSLEGFPSLSTDKETYKTNVCCVMFLCSQSSGSTTASFWKQWCRLFAVKDCKVKPCLPQWGGRKKDLLICRGGGDGVFK